MRSPLKEMQIRTPIEDHTTYAGKANLISGALAGTRGDGVRNHGHRAHQGWDLYAPEGTQCYAISNGKVAVVATRKDDWGLYVTLEFRGQDPRDRQEKPLYALYAHLKASNVHEGQSLREGECIGLTGTSGNAKGGPPHLHFGILRHKHPLRGMDDNIDPGHFVGFHHLTFDVLFPNWGRV